MGLIQRQGQGGLGHIQVVEPVSPGTHDLGLAVGGESLVQSEGRLARQDQLIGSSTLLTGDANQVVAIGDQQPLSLGQRLLWSGRERQQRRLVRFEAFGLGHAAEGGDTSRGLGLGRERLDLQADARADIGQQLDPPKMVDIVIVETPAEQVAILRQHLADQASLTAEFLSGIGRVIRLLFKRQPGKGLHPWTAPQQQGQPCQ